jgi:selenocysteine lyase/cysteine desulfurase
MASATLPAHIDVTSFQQRLYKDSKVEIPMIEWNGKKFARISVQGYNTGKDIDRLLHALSIMLEKM